MNEFINNEFENQRQQLEQRIADVLQHKMAAVEGFAGASHSELLHELSVYHQELEFQNEALRSTQIELEAVKDRYADLFNLAPYGYVVIDGDQYIQLANQTFAEMLGTTPRPLVGALLTHFVDPTSQDALYFHLRTVYGEKSPQTTEIILAGARGRVPVRVESLPDYHSGMIFVRMAFIDISRERAAVAALRASETRYRLLIEMADDIVLVCALDKAGALERIVEANNAACKRLGYDHGRLTNMPLKQVIDDSASPALQGDLRSEQRSIFETWLKPDSAPAIPVEIHASLFDWQNQPMALLIARDITQRLKLEAERREMERYQQEMQKWQSLGALAGGVAHDFNNLMTAIANELEVIHLKTTGHGEIEANIRRAQEAVRRGAEVTAQMLAYTGRTSLSLIHVDLNQLVSQALGLVKQLFTETQKVQVRLAPQLPSLRVDPGQLEQTMIALLTNAAEALGNQPGEVTISTSLRVMDAETLKQSRVTPIPEEGAYVCLQVQDTGAGMNEETQRRIFDPFFTTRFAGRGLGMAAVHGIVRAHHGAIFVNSQPGHGATFCLLLPVPEISATTPDSEAGQPPINRDTPDVTTVLVVEDEEILRSTCHDVLDALGYQTLLAECGEVAVEIVKQQGNAIGCVLLDLTMPGMNGVEAYNAMRAIKPDLRVIITSGHDAEDVLDDFPDNGIIGYVQKPYSMNELHRQLKRAMAQRR